MTTPTQEALAMTAAAGIEAIKAKDAEIAALKADLAAAQSELASVKAHAEALHLQLERFIGDHFFSAPHTNLKTDEALEAKQVADAYRRDFPKEGA